MMYRALAVLSAIILVITGLAWAQQEAPAAPDASAPAAETTVTTGDKIEFEYRDYVVQKGDTLWSITRSQLSDSFLWPMVWKENVRINNPDLIYPGQTIKIPIGIKAKAAPVVEEPAPVTTEVARTVDEPVEPAPVVEEPAPVVEEPAPVAPPVVEEPAPQPVSKTIGSRQLILHAGYISKEIPNAGRLTGSPQGRVAFGQFDEVFITPSHPVSKGDKFYVIRRGPDVYHPRSKNPIGNLYQVIGTVETIESGVKDVRARVKESFDNLELRDFLGEYYDVNLPRVTGDPRKPQINGLIVATRNMRTINGITDIVFIDKGSAEGVIEGDIFITLIENTARNTNAFIQIINVRDHTSLGMIRSSSAEVQKGDEFMGVRE